MGDEGAAVGGDGMYIEIVGPQLEQLQVEYVSE